jgi:hypothetical protein
MYCCTTIPHATKLKATLIANKACGGIIDSFPEAHSRRPQ